MTRAAAGFCPRRLVTRNGKERKQLLAVYAAIADRSRNQRRDAAALSATRDCDPLLNKLVGTAERAAGVGRRQEGVVVVVAATTWNNNCDNAALIVTY